MPNIKKETTTPIATTKVDTTAITKENAELKKENENLQKSVNDLLDKVNQLMASMENKSDTAPDIAGIKDESYNSVTKEYEEPNANAQIKVMSTCYGSLNLCNNSNRSVGKLLSFNKFGQIKSVLYHDLVDYVNNERKFAEQGYFYILDKNAVYSLGLSEDYEKLVDGNIMKNIMTYNISDIEAIVSSMTHGQRETLVNLLADRLYNGENLDRNKLEVINKASGVDVVAKANQKKEYSNIKTSN